MIKFITKEGLKKIKEELERRKGETRQRIAGAIKEAKEQGDISENAEYTEAKRQLSENETRVSELEVMLKEATVVSHNKASSVVQLGSVISVRSKQGQEMKFHIVGSNEANPSNMKISNESPMGKGFMNHGKGDIVEIETPGGKSVYEILDLK